MSDSGSTVIVALDYAQQFEAIEMADKLESYAPYLKVGMQLYYAAGPELVRLMKAKGFPVFMDLKLHDIPHTVKGAVRSLTHLGVDMINVHCVGGRLMMEAAVEGMQAELDAMLDAGVNPSENRPKLIGVTQLTSTSQQMMNDEIGISGKLENSIVHYAQIAQEAGLDGVVCSALEVPMIKQACGSEFLTITPGIRPVGVSNNDQVRITTPAQAQRLGSDYMVIGRAITQAKNPVKVYQDIQNELVASQ